MLCRRFPRAPTQGAACVSFTRGLQRADVARPCRALHRAQASYNGVSSGRPTSASPGPAAS
jgi:hypothetical protein